MASTVWDILSSNDQAEAIGAPGKEWLSGQSLAELAAAVRTSLNAGGIGRGDRVAIVLPNGPDMAACFVTIASCCAAAPLNPTYKAAEFEFYLTDLKPAALILANGDSSPSREICQSLGIPIINLIQSEATAGRFRLDTSALPARPAAQSGPAQAADVALVLHTSGTTARPKIVPLTNRNLVASARNIAETLALSPGDKCLNIMPLFHIHGLIAAVLASLQAGAAVCCTSGLVFKFSEWLRDVRPTWYTAVPTMHQAILKDLRDRNAEAQAAALRFIRSSSASLPPQVMVELEQLFASPVIEAYGMTEAAHQMASNPLDGARKPGSVGLPAGPEVAIMNDAGEFLPRGVAGEVVIRGENVTEGYDKNPEANARAFSSGWFRTGDEGRLDGDGYLFLTGRLKEQINRGGEKISPLEIDVVLLDHPAVAQAVTFAMPHDTLGEEVAAAVVLHDGATTTERELRRFAASRVAEFKVPRRVVILDSIPKGATGKVQRIGLAARLGLVPAINAAGTGL